MPVDHRRWFRLSLRGLLLLIAFVGAFLAWQLRWVHERRELVARHQAAKQQILDGVRNGNPRWMDGSGFYCQLFEKAPAPFPWRLALVGERRVPCVRLSFDGGVRSFEDESNELFHHSDIDRARELFPEAEVRWTVYYSSPEHERSAIMPAIGAAGL